MCQYCNASGQCSVHTIDQYRKSTTMKVIVAGMSKTGTKSLKAAFSKLGYSVYDSVEHFIHHHNEWSQILSKGGSIEMFRKMYEEVDVVVGLPVYAFWEQIHFAFPNAKVGI